MSEPSITLSPEFALKHQPQELVRLAGPALGCTCGVIMYAPNEDDLAKMWREHLLREAGWL